MHIDDVIGGNMPLNNFHKSFGKIDNSWVTPKLLFYHNIFILVWIQ